MKGVVDYLKENGKYLHDAMGRDFTLELEGKVVILKFHGHEWWIAARSNRNVEDEIIFLLEENFGIEIRFCRTCGAPIDHGFMECGGEFYSCEEHFEESMDEVYGKGKWRASEYEGEYGGFYEFLDHDDEWEDTGIFYTEWY